MTVGRSFGECSRRPNRKTPAEPRPEGEVRIRDGRSAGQIGSGSYTESAVITRSSLPGSHWPQTTCPRGTNSKRLARHLGFVRDFLDLFGSKRRPTTAAARCRLPNAMLFRGSSGRSTCERLVLTSAALLLFEIFLVLIAPTSCRATTSLTAWGCAPSSVPTSLRKSPMLDPMTSSLIAPTPAGYSVLPAYEPRDIPSKRCAANPLRGRGLATYATIARA